jgi:hypothetical protein
MYTTECLLVVHADHKHSEALSCHGNNSLCEKCLSISVCVHPYVCRRALLLACCSSPHTAAWVLAVPTVVQQLQQQCFKLGQPCESHGAMWQLLMHKHNTNAATTGSSSSRAQPVKQAVSSSAKPAGATASSGSSGGAEGRDEGLEQQLLSLLQLQGSSSVQLLQRQVVVLQLMVDAQAAAGRGQRLWSDAVRTSDDAVGLGWAVHAGWPHVAEGCASLGLFQKQEPVNGIRPGVARGLTANASEPVSHRVNKQCSLA